jgi:hypothetical protein
MKKTEQHPALPLSITFDPDNHSYTDNTGKRYTSATEFVKQCFEPFDEMAAAERIAKRDNRIEAEIISEWRAKAKASADYGTNVHAYAESLVLGMTPPEPGTSQERRAFQIVDKAMTHLERHYEFLGAEQIVFDPLFDLAGTIDLPARNKATGAIAILDWKTCEDITDDSFGKFAFEPIQNIRDSKVSHYALQLSLYGWMLTDQQYSAYPTAGDPVELALIHIPHIGSDPVWREMVYYGDAVKKIALKKIGQ